jgi:catechol 2,3-dioxygenase-like lactoylglutathione lyase family enzyme
MSQTNSDLVSVRYMIDDVDAAVAFYTNHLGFSLARISH